MQIPTKEAFSPYVDCKRRTPPVRSMKDNYPSVHIENLTRLSPVLLTHLCTHRVKLMGPLGPSYNTVADGLHQ